MQIYKYNERNYLEFFPSKGLTESPYIIWLHGGDWRGYDWIRKPKRSCPVKFFSNHEYAVFSIDYLGVERASYDAYLSNCKDALQWIAERKEKFRIEVNKGAFFAFGGGANMALVLALKKNPYIQAIVCCSPHTLTTNPDNPGIPRSYQYEPEQFFPGARSVQTIFKGMNAHQSWKNALKAMPELQISKNATPVFLAHGIDNQLLSLNQSTRFFKQLRKANNQVTLVLIEDLAHGLNIVDETFDLTLGFLNSQLKNCSTSFCEYQDKIICQKRNKKRSVFSKFEEEENPFRVWFSSLGIWEDQINAKWVGLSYKESIRSKILNCNVEYYICLPPSYRIDTERCFPVLYYLTPHVISPRQYALNVCNPRYDAMQAGEIPEMIIVMPYHNNKKIDIVKESISEQVICEELIPYIECTYRTKNDKKFRAIEGECAAGRNSLLLAFRRPDVFGNVFVTAPLYDPLVFQEIHKRRDLICRNRIYLEIGEYDPNEGYLEGAKQYRKSFEHFGLNFEFNHVQSSGHNSIELALDQIKNPYSHYQSAFGDSSYHCSAKSNEYIIHRDLVFDEVNDLKLDLFLPDKEKSKLLIWINGGDWRGEFWRRDHKRYECPVKDLCSFGFSVASIDIRSSEEGKFPAQIEDCINAIDWLYGNQEVYGYHSDCLGIISFSSGALISVFTVIETLKNTVLETGWKISAVSTISGVFDCSNLDHMRRRNLCKSGNVYELPNSPVDALFENREDRFKFQNCIKNLKELKNLELPSFFILHGMFNNIVPIEQSGLFYKSLERMKTDVQFKVVKNGTHAIRTLNCMEDLGNFFNEKLNGVQALVNFYSTPVNKKGSISIDVSENKLRFNLQKTSFYSFFSQITNSQVNLMAYLHRNYDDELKDFIRVIYFFHDKNESLKENLLFAEYYSLACKSGAAIPAIIIFRENHLSSFETENKFDEMFLKEMVPFVENTFGISQKGKERIAVGIGEGAECCIRLGIQHSGLFDKITGVVDTEVIKRVANNLYDSISCLELVHVIEQYENREEKGCFLKIIRSTPGVRYVRLDALKEDLLYTYLESDYESFAFSNLAL